jgi:outer membrane lipoprotein-sorting protein
MRLRTPILVVLISCVVLLIGYLFFAQQSKSDSMLKNAEQQISKATTLSVSVDERYDEFNRSFETRWWFKKGGYYRSESPQGTLICNPERCLSYKPNNKAYMVFPGAQTNWSLQVETGLGEFGSRSRLPTIGDPKRVRWKGLDVWQVEVDGTKSMTKETKMYYFFDPKTKAHVGTSANLGSIEQVRMYKDLKVNPKLDDSLFRFDPPKDWKLIKD